MEAIYKYLTCKAVIFGNGEHGLKRTTMKDACYKYGGDFGEDMPSDGNFVCDGLVGPNRELHLWPK